MTSGGEAGYRSVRDLRPYRCGTFAPMARPLALVGMAVLRQVQWPYWSGSAELIVWVGLRREGWDDDSEVMP